MPHHARDMVFDPVRGQFWLSDDLGNKLVRVGCEERGVIAEHPVRSMPESLALSPDGHWLYAALITRPHDSYWFEGREGYIAEIAVATGAGPRTFRIQEDPYDLLVTDAGALTVTGGSAQWTSINSYLPRSANPDSPVASFQIRQASPIVLHPDQRAAFSITTDTSPSDITRWILGGSSGEVTSSWDSRYHGDYGMMAPLWIQPDGQRLYTGVGSVFRLNPAQEQDLIFVRNLPEGPFSAMTFDAPNRTLFAAGGTTLRLFNLDSLEQALQWTTPHPVGFLALHETNLYVVSIEANRTRFIRYLNPARDAGNNLAPTASFSWTPASPTVLDEIQFSAAESSDDQPVRELQFRWDWNNDGVFETEFTNRATASIQYQVAGTKQVTLEVRDGFGAVGRKTLSVAVAMVTDPGDPVSTNAAFALQFPAFDVATDPHRPFLYASDPIGKKLVRVNLSTGFIDREFFFNFGPERLTVTPDGKRLFAVIPAQPHAYFGGQQKGFVAEVDLASGTRTGIVEVDVDPYDIVATDDGILVISDGSNQWTTLTTHEAATGRRLSSFGIYMGGILGLAPNQRAVYHLNAGLSPADLNRHGFDAAGVFTTSWDSPYHGDFPTGQPYPHPDGTRVIASGGVIYTASATQASDLVYVGPLPGGSFSDLAFDPENRAFFAVRTGAPATLTAYSLDSLQEARVIQLPTPAHRVGLSDDQVVLTTLDAGETRFSVRPNPMTGALTNRPPAAAFTWFPASPNTLDPVRLDPGASSDDGGAANLHGRWDWNGDGVFDTEFTPLDSVSHKFSFAGEYSVQLEVRDSFGSVGAVTQRLLVQLAADPGVAVTNSVPNEVGFNPSDVAFDPRRPHLYATDKSGRRLVRMNLTNGLVDREFRFDLMPERLTITPDGRRMYVALLLREHSSFVFGEQSGVIAEFDLTTGVKTREFPVTIDPFDLVATDAGWLVVSSGSGQWTTLKSFRTADGQEVGSTGQREGSRLTLHPSQDTVYGSLFLIPSDFDRITLDPATGAVANRGDSPYHGDHPMGFQCWALADGRTVVTSEGGVYTTLQSYVGSLASGVHDALANLDRGQVFTLSPEGLRAFSLEDLTAQGMLSLPGRPDYLADFEGRLYVVTTSGDSASLISKRYPARNAAENEPPEVSISVPVAGAGVAAGQALTVTALAGDPDGEVTAVEFILDGGDPVRVPGSPWSTEFPPLVTGGHSLVAVATDNWGASRTSAPVNFRVSLPPALTLTATVTGLQDPATVELEAEATDTDGEVREVIFFRGDTELGRAGAPPFRLTLRDVPKGVYTFGAVAVDDAGVRSQTVTTLLGVNILPGDYFANRLMLSGSELTTTANTQAATRESGEPDHAGVPGGHSLWWEWTPPENVGGTLVLDTSGSSFDTLLAVYSGAALQVVSANDNASPGVTTSRVKLSVNPTPVPVRYYIAVDGRENAAGEVQLRLSFLPSVNTGVNDRFFQRLPLLGIEGESSAFNVLATSEAGEPRHAGIRPSRSLWWTWTAPANGRLVISTAGSSLDTVLATYTGNFLGALVPVTSNDDEGSGLLTSFVELPVQLGTAYQIAVDGYQGQTGLVRLAYAFTQGMMAGLSLEADGAMKLRVEAPGAQEIIVERSGDLRQWTPIQTNTVVNGIGLWNLPAPEPEGAGFFRLRTP